MLNKLNFVLFKFKLFIKNQIRGLLYLFCYYI